MSITSGDTNATLLRITERDARRIVELEAQRDELLAALSELTSTVGLAIDGATGWDAHKNARKLLASVKGQSCP